MGQRAIKRQNHRRVARMVVVLAIPVVVTVPPAVAARTDAPAPAVAAVTPPPTCLTAPLMLAALSTDGTYRGADRSGYGNADWAAPWLNFAWAKDHCIFVGTGYDPINDGPLETGASVSVAGNQFHTGVNTLTVTAVDGYQHKRFRIVNSGTPTTDVIEVRRDLYPDLAGNSYPTAPLSAPLGAFLVGPQVFSQNGVEVGRISMVDAAACRHDPAASGSSCTYTVTIPDGTPAFVGSIHFVVREGRVVRPPGTENYDLSEVIDPTNLWTPAEIPAMAFPISYDGSSSTLAAAFTSTVDATSPGLVHNVSTSPADAVHTWDYGDGTPAGLALPTNDHQYAKPGTYTVSLTVTRNGEANTTTQQVVVAAPTLQVVVTSSSGSANASVGDAITMNVALTASTTGLGNITVAPADATQLLAATGGYADTVDDAAPAPIVLPPGGTQQFTATFTGKDIGAENFTGTFNVTDAAGATVSASGAKVITIRKRALTVTVTVNPASIVQPEDADGPKPVTINVTAVVKNVLDTNIDDVSVDVNPAFVWTASTPSPVPFPMASTTPATPSAQIGTLAPGASATITYVESALDDALLNVSVVAVGTPTGSNTHISGIGVAPLEVKPKYDFRFSAKPEQQYSGSNPVATPGATIDFFLGLKNLTNTKNLAVAPMAAQITGNAVAGGGNAYPIEQAAAQPPCSAPWSGKLEAGSSEKSLQARVTTVDLGQGVGNAVSVGYQPTVFEQTGPTSFQQIDPARQLITAGATPTSVRLEPNIVVPPYEFGDAVFGFTDGGFRHMAAMGQAFFRTVPALLAMYPALVRQTTNVFTWPYAVAERMVTYWSSLGRAERADFVNTVIHELAVAEVKFTDFAINLQSVLPAWFDEFSTAVDTGDTQHMGSMLGVVGTEVGVQLLTDKALGVIAEQVGLCKLAQVPKATLETAETDLQARYLAELPEGEKTLAKLTEKDSKLLRSGLLANPEIAYRVYGINAQQLNDLYKLAREEGILIEIRPNGGYRHAWIESGAALKPEALKLKTVSKLDLFLGYDINDLGSLILKKPQSAEEFAQIYAQVVGSDGQLVADALKTRWEARTTEWVKDDLLNLYKGFEKEGLPVGFNGTDNGLIGPNQARRVEFKMVETKPGYYQLEMQRIDKLVDGVEVSKDLHRITGDIDLLDIRLANGQPVPASRRLEIYRALEEIAGIQHPSVTTWMKNGQASFDAKLAYYADLAYQPGKATEAAMEIAPDKKSRIVRTVMSQSWINSAEDSFIYYKGGYLDLEYDASLAPGWTPKAPATPATTTGPTIITQPITKGSTIVPVTSYGTITVGSMVVINPGRPNQETATVAAFHSLDLAAPLLYDHNVGEVIIPASEFAPSGSFQTLIPARLLDTRNAGPTVDGVGSGGGSLDVGQRLVLPVVGRAGVPAGALAAVLNVVVTEPPKAGYLIVWPCSTPKPLASSLNFAAGWTVANSLTVGLAADGTVCIESSVAGVQVVADVTGFAKADSGFVVFSPARLLDTRDGGATVDGVGSGGGRLDIGQRLVLPVTGRAGVPAGATAAVLNVVVTEPPGPGYLIVWPCSAPKPLASSLNFSTNWTVANSLVVGLATDGTVCVESSTPGVHVVIDIAGYAKPDSGFAVFAGLRLLDTRDGGTTVDGVASGGGRLGPGQRLVLPVTGRAGVPAGATAVVLNVVVTEPPGPGFLVVYPCSEARPLASSLNFDTGWTVANSLIVGLSASGTVCIESSIPGVHVVADITGYDQTH